MEIIRNRLQGLRALMPILKSHQSLSREEFVSNFEKQLSAEHALQLAIQHLLAISSHLLASRGVRELTDYRDVLIKMGKEAILPQDFAERISKMAGFRNLLVHDYAEVDPELVYEFLQYRVVDFEEFMKHIAAHLKL